MRVGLRSLTAGLLGVVAAMAALPVRADVIVTGIPTFGGGKENVAATLRVLDAIDPSIVYLGKFRETGAVSGTVNSTTGSILFYDVQAGRHSDLVQLGTPGETVGWTTDWSNLTKKGKFRNASYIAIFGVANPVTGVPEPASILLLGAGLLGLGLVRRRGSAWAGAPVRRSSEQA